MRRRWRGGGGGGGRRCTTAVVIVVAGAAVVVILIVAVVVVSAGEQDVDDAQAWVEWQVSMCTLLPKNVPRQEANTASGTNPLNNGPYLWKLLVLAWSLEEMRPGQGEFESAWVLGLRTPAFWVVFSDLMTLISAQLEISTADIVC